MKTFLEYKIKSTTPNVTATPNSNKKFEDKRSDRSFMPNYNRNKPVLSSSFNTRTREFCMICKNRKSPHATRRCAILRSSTPFQVLKITHEHKLCRGCYKPWNLKHSCPVKCSKCGRTHETRLHEVVAQQIQGGYSKNSNIRGYHGPSRGNFPRNNGPRFSGPRRYGGNNNSGGRNDLRNDNRINNRNDTRNDTRNQAPQGNGNNPPSRNIEEGRNNAWLDQPVGHGRVRENVTSYASSRQEALSVPHKGQQGLTKSLPAYICSLDSNVKKRVRVLLDSASNQSLIKRKMLR